MMGENRNIPQPMQPHGLTGRLFGWVMERVNTPAYKLALTLMAPKPREHILEIGFGTGRLAAMALNAYPGLNYAGVDPSALMLEKAQRQTDGLADLRLGTADDLPWQAGQFDCVAALHSQQFWPDPARAFQNIYDALKPGGRLVLIFRDHSKNAPDWLPNPISRDGNEIADTITLVRELGFEDVQEGPKAGSSTSLTAHKSLN